MKTLTQLTKKFKTRPEKPSPYLSPADVRVYLRAVLNLAKHGHSPAVITKAFEDFLSVYRDIEDGKRKTGEQGRTP